MQTSADTFQNMALQFADFTKATQEPYAYMRQDISDTGIYDNFSIGQEYIARMKNPKSKELFVKRLSLPENMYCQGEYWLNYNHPCIQYLMQGVVIDLAIKEYKTRHYQTLWKKWVNKLPLIFRLERKRSAYGTIHNNKLFYSGEYHPATMEYFDSDIYEFFLRLEENFGDWTKVIDFTFDLTHGTFTLDKFNYTICMRKNGNYALQAIQATSVETDEIYYKSAIDYAQEIIKLLNRTE